MKLIESEFLKMGKDGTIMAQDMILTSMGGFFPHVHSLIIPMGAIENPPEMGVVLFTSDEFSLIFLHKHKVTLTKWQLQRIKAGKEMTLFDDSKKGHSFFIPAKA